MTLTIKKRDLGYQGKPVWNIFKGQTFVGYIYFDNLHENEYVFIPSTFSVRCSFGDMKKISNHLEFVNAYEKEKHCPAQAQKNS